MRTALYGGLPCQLLHLHGRAEHCADDCSAYFIGQTQLACSIAYAELSATADANGEFVFESVVSHPSKITVTKE